MKLSYLGFWGFGVPDDLKGLLLNEAIPGQLGDRNVNYVKIAFVVHKGAIYAAQTSDAGSTYHGYPYKGRLSGRGLRSTERDGGMGKIAEKSSRNGSSHTYCVMVKDVDRGGHAFSAEALERL